MPPDKTLFETGLDYLRKSQYVKTRLAMQTLMNTYPDSELAPDALLAVGDSYYDEGGSENLLQAEDSYNSFIVFFPAHPKAADALLKTISLNFKMVGAPDRDRKYTIKALDYSNKFLTEFPNSDYIPIVKRIRVGIEENIATGELAIAKFYEDRDNYAGSGGRLQEIVVKYKDFSLMDEVLFRLASAQEQSKNVEEAALNYAKIISDWPFSKWVDEAKHRLNSLGKPLPPIDTELALLNYARVKPPESFSPLKPFVEFAKALGVVPSPDIYEQARKSVAEAKTAESTTVTIDAGGPATSDILIESTIKKSASGKTQDTTILGNSLAQPVSQEKKKEANRSSTRKKKSTKKTS